MTLAGGTYRVARAPFDARCVVAGGPPTIENVAHAQLDSQEKILRLVRQFFPMACTPLQHQGFVIPLVSKRRSAYGSARHARTRRPMLDTRLATVAHRATEPLSFGSAAPLQRVCALGRSLQKPATDRLWKEFVARSAPKPQKFDHSPAVEGVKLSGLFSAAFRVAQTMSRRYVRENSHYPS